MAAYIFFLRALLSLSLSDMRALSPSRGAVLSLCRGSIAEKALKLSHCKMNAYCLPASLCYCCCFCLCVCFFLCYSFCFFVLATGSAGETSFSLTFERFFGIFSDSSGFINNQLLINNKSSKEFWNLNNYKLIV